MDMKNILKGHSKLKPTFGNGLTNHLPMVLYSMNHLGFKEDDIKKYAENYVNERSIVCSERCHFVINDLSDYLGKKKYYSELVVFFANKIDKDGVEKVIRAYIDILLEGSSGDAFHGLIRLAYALEYGYEDEICRALAYMADSYVNYDINVFDLPSRDPMETIMMMSRSEYFKERTFKLPLIIGRMIEISKDQETLSLLNRLPNKYVSEKCIHELAIRLYSLTENFTMLHGFTSTHALSILLPYINKKELVFQLHWLHIQIAYLSTNCTEIKPFEKYKDASWEWIFEKVRLSNDEHTMKLIYSLHKCNDKFQNESWSSLYNQLAKSRIMRELDL